MKRSFRILLVCMAVLVASVVGAAVQQVDPGLTYEFIRQHAELMAAAPVIVSASITPELINDMKVKYGRIKVITVVVEAPAYDIDDIPFKDRVALKELGVDFATVINPELKIKDRLMPLAALVELKDDPNKSELANSLYSKYKGKELEKGEQYQFLVKRPDRGLIKMLLPLAEARKIDEFSEKAVKNLIVGGDLSALDDGLVFMGVVSQLRTMISPAQSFLSNA